MRLDEALDTPYEESPNFKSASSGGLVLRGGARSGGTRRDTLHDRSTIPCSILDELERICRDFVLVSHLTHHLLVENILAHGCHRAPRYALLQYSTVLYCTLHCYMTIVKCRLFNLLCP